MTILHSGAFINFACINMYGLTPKPGGLSSSLSSLSESLKSAGVGDGGGEKSSTAERRLSSWMLSIFMLLAAVRFKFCGGKSTFSTIDYCNRQSLSATCHTLAYRFYRKYVNSLVPGSDPHGQFLSHDLTRLQLILRLL